MQIEIPFLWCRFCGETREHAAEIPLSKHVHHYPFIGVYCLFTVAPFPETPRAGLVEWGVTEQWPFFSTRYGLRNAHHSASTQPFTEPLAAHEWQLNPREVFPSTGAEAGAVVWRARPSCSAGRSALLSGRHKEQEEQGTGLYNSSVLATCSCCGPEDTRWRCHWRINRRASMGCSLRMWDKNICT